MPGVYIFEGELDTAALSAAFKNLIQRHESLRTVFHQNEEGTPRQIILPADIAATAFQVACKDLQQEPEETVHRYIQQDLQQVFDLTKGPLIRAALYQVAASRWIFTYVMHHICSDGWSMEILIRELLQSYSTCRKGEQAPLLPLGIQYKDYACWQQQQLEGDTLNLHKKYWLHQLQGQLPVIELPLDNSRPAVKNYRGSNISKPVSGHLTDGLRGLCRQQDATLFMGLLASVTALLHQYSRQQDIIVGSPVAGRQHADLSDQIGCYLNTLALRLRFDEQSSFTDLLLQAKQITLEAYEHEVYPFDQLIEDLQLHRDMSRSPLFDVLIDYHDNRSSAQNAELGTRQYATQDQLLWQQHSAGEQV